MGKAWVGGKVVVTLTRQELLDLISAISNPDFGDIEFAKVKNKKIQDAVRKRMERREKLWRKLNTQLIKEVKNDME